MLDLFLAYIDCCLNSLRQYYSWCYAFLPDGEMFIQLVQELYVGLSGMPGTKLHSRKGDWVPFEVVFSACLLLLYWGGLQKAEQAVKLKAGRCCSSLRWPIFFVCAKVRSREGTVEGWLEVEGRTIPMQSWTFCC